MTTKNSYWERRAIEERKWQKANLADDAKFNRLLEQYYKEAIVQINKDIDQQYQALASTTGGLRSAYRAVDDADIQAYMVEAQKVVNQANKLRSLGKTVTYADFSDEVNQHMRVYNATMRINRLEYLKSQIGLHLTEANMNIDDSMRLKLTDSYVDEVKRQAGILGQTVKFNKFLIADNISKIVMAQTAGATWSQRLWANQDALKAQLDHVLATGFITGQSNQAMARWLKSQIKDTVNNARYVTERLARTESARVQYQAQIDSIKAADYKYVKWYAEPGACHVCQEIADNDRYDLGYGVFPIDEAPSIPVHPNCRCSISAYWVDSKDNVKSGKKTRSNKTFDELMETDINKLHEKDIIQIGSKAYKILAKDGKELSSQIKVLQKNFKDINESYNAGKFKSYNDYLENWQLNADAIKLLSNQYADKVAQEVQKYRKVGDIKIKFQPRSSVPLRKMIQTAYDHYPTDWAKNAESRNTLKVLNVKRGYYADSQATIAANKDDYDAQSTMYHELGHRAEHSNPEIMRLEQEFYERRTKDESLQPLSKLTGNKAYDKSMEKARPDDFNNPYMGKEYVDFYGKHYGYELLSMGVEGIYQGKYNLYEDEDMAKFILGLLLKG